MNIKELNEAIDKALCEDFPKSLTNGYSQADISPQGNYKHFDWKGDGIAYQLDQNKDLYSFHITCLPQGSFAFCEETPVNYLLTVWKGDFHSGEALLEECITSNSVEEAHKELMSKLHSLNINVNDITIEDLQKIYKEPNKSYQKRMKDLRNSMRKSDNKFETGITESLKPFKTKKALKEAWTDTVDKEQVVLDSIEEKIDEFFPNATINHYIDSYTGKSFGKVYIPYSDINLSSEQLEILDEKINTEYFISINDKRFNEGQPYAYFNDKAKRIEVGDFVDKVKKSSFVKNVVTVIKDIYDLIEQQGKSESVADKKSMKEDEGFKVGDFVFSRAHFRYGYIKDFDGRLYTVEFVCSVYGAEEMATTDSVAPAYLEDGNIRLDSQIDDLERQLAAQKKIKEKFANKVTNEAVTAKKSMKEENTSNWKVIYHIEGDVEFDIQAENEDDSLKKAYDKLSKLSFREIERDHDVDYKCIKVSQKK